MVEMIDGNLAQSIAQRYLAQAENLVRFQLDANPDLEVFKLDLLGKQYNEQGNLVEVAGLQPLINEQGANVIITFLRNRLGKVVSLSNVDEQEVRIRCKEFMDALTFLLGRHHQEWAIPSYQVMDNIIELCDDVFYTTMMKAYLAGERDTIRKQFQHIESSELVMDKRQPTAPQQQGGFRLPFFGGK